jgi:hypothetical protein
MKYLLLLSVILAFSCSKKSDSKSEYGCVYGKSKETGDREYIRCSYKEIFYAGYNQEAADAIAEKHNVPHERVTDMKNYTDWEFIKDCDCNP